MPLLSECFYFAGLEPGALAARMERFAREVTDRVLYHLDGANIATEFLDPDADLEWRPEEGGTPKRLSSGILSKKGYPSLRRKGPPGANKTYGLELHVDPSSSTYGKVCVVNGDTPTVQRFSIATDVSSATNPGATLRTPTGALTLDTGVDQPATIKRNGATILVAMGDGTNPRVGFGGTTSSFPALKRSAAELQARLADDSAYAEFRCENVFAAQGQFTDDVLCSLGLEVTGTLTAMGEVKMPTAAPGTPADGHVWVDGSSLFWRDGGTTYGVEGTPV